MGTSTKKQSLLQDELTFGEDEEAQLLEEFCLTLNGDCRILSEQTYRPTVTTDQRVADCLAVLDAVHAPFDNSTYLQSRWGGGCPQRFFAVSESSCQGRCFFLTTTGLLGLGPRVATVEDVVFFFYGAQVPFLLHPVTSSEGEYRLCGECYVHGMMKGEEIERPEEEFIRLI